MNVQVAYRVGEIIVTVENAHDDGRTAQEFKRELDEIIVSVQAENVLEAITNAVRIQIAETLTELANSVIDSNIEAEKRFQHNRPRWDALISQMKK